VASSEVHRIAIAIFNCKAKLPFPHATRCQIGQISDQSVIISTARGEFTDAEVVLNQLKTVNESFGIF
jgi:hypothetical protein